MQALYQKQGRSAQFSSVAERDRWLNEKVKKLQEAQGKTAATRRAIQSTAAGLNTELMELSQVWVRTAGSHTLRCPTCAIACADHRVRNASLLTEYRESRVRCRQPGAMLLQSLGDMESNIKTQEKSLADVDKERTALLQRRDTMQNERRALWHDENGIKE